MNVATVIAVAVSWWGGHGYVAQQPVTWAWSQPGESQCAGQAPAGCAVPGSYHITLERQAWDRMRAWQKCVVVAHEIGHAAFSFGHRDATIMDPIHDFSYPPGACFGPPIYSKVRALPWL